MSVASPSALETGGKSQALGDSINTSAIEIVGWTRLVMCEANWEVDWKHSCGAYQE